MPRERMTYQRLYLLGHPVAHSKSPVMHNAVYERLGLAWRYDLADCATDKAAEAFLAESDFLALNITTPYKRNALRAASASAASAKLAEGANLLVRKSGVLAADGRKAKTAEPAATGMPSDVLIAYNTDGQGCVAYLEREGVRFRDASVVVCGTGPTALAIVHAASVAGAREVVLVGRSKERSHKVLEKYVHTFGVLATSTIDLPAVVEGHRSFREAYEKTKFKFGSYATSTQAIHAADVIVDATPLGMNPGDSAPFDPALFRAGQIALDTVYGHGETAFCLAARAAGCEAHDGAGMLVAQAAITMQTVCDIAEVSLDAAFPTFDSLFAFMAAAAGFDC